MKTCSKFTCSSVRFRKKGGQSEAKRELQTQISKETLKVGGEALKQLVSAQGKATVWGRGRCGSSPLWLGSNALSVTLEFQRGPEDGQTRPRWGRNQTWGTGNQRV